METTSRLLTLKNAATNRYEFVAQIGAIITDRVGRQIGFRATQTSPNFKTESEATTWLREAIR